MSVGRYESASCKRDYAVLYLSYYGMSRMRPLDYFIDVLDQLEGVRSMYYDRLFRLFRDFSLVYGLFAGARVLALRTISYMALRIVLFSLSRRVSAMRYGAAMIACSASASMYVQGSYSSLIVADFFRL